jgi:hypothetical protein
LGKCSSLEIGEKPKMSVRGLEHVREVVKKRCFEEIAAAAAEAGVGEIEESK